MNLAAIAEMKPLSRPRRDPIESGGDNLAATFSPELADLTLYVVDVARARKSPARAARASPAPTC